MEFSRTKKEMYKAIIEVLENVEDNSATELIDFANHEIELLTKKSGSKAKKTNEEFISIENEILSVMEENMLYKVTDIVKALGYEYTTSKLTPRLTELVAQGKVKNTKDKKSSVYSLVVEDTTEVEVDE